MAQLQSLFTARPAVSRLQEVFEKINLTDSRVDHDLELHEFLALLIDVAFHRANPRYSEATVAKGQRVVPLQVALSQMLENNLLRSKRKEELSTMQERFEQDEEVSTLVQVGITETAVCVVRLVALHCARCLAWKGNATKVWAVLKG